ncbi:MAG TPA: MauE/DoxX family redox-associated membrane protein [Syntrophobacteraceae bacterium]|nr:MauE/DoxX family redox-associated membrane protein [Syntrophobacteraceae bacterium]
MMGAFIKRIVTSEYLAFVLRIYVGYFFIYASMSKIPYPAQFAEATANYRIIPYWLLNSGAVFLPWIEFVAGLFLIIGFMSRASVVLIGCMLVMFNVMVLINMYWGAPISCGCYDTVGEPIGWKKILENAVMLVFAVQIFFYDRLFIFRRGGFSRAARKRVPSPAGAR